MKQIHSKDKKLIAKLAATFKNAAGSFKPPY